MLVAGAKGAVASTLAVAVAAIQATPQTVLPNLTTADKFPYLGSPQSVHMAGWDKDGRTLPESVEDHGVLPENLWRPFADDLHGVPVCQAPSTPNFRGMVERLLDDIGQFRGQFPNAIPVFINLLPAGVRKDLTQLERLSQIYSQVDPTRFPDLAYTTAAILSGIPVVNFTSNQVEIPAIIHEASQRCVPMCGRDGKTGQTYLKVVLASALEARRLFVDGWYSLNLLGNADGSNLMDPQKAEEKVTNKIEVLDEILGYAVGEKYGISSHKVHIDYYRPRGDAKEAWDVIDFQGMFGLPMSLRLNLLGRDSVLAAPLVLDLARWMAVLQMAGRSGPVSQLAFYFKRPVGNSVPLNFQDQVTSLKELEADCHKRITRIANKPQRSLAGHGQAGRPKRNDR